MTKKYKKLCALILACILLITCLAGCAGSKSGSSETETDRQSETQSDKPLETESESEISGHETDEVKVTFKEADLPENAGWQTDVTFPDWRGSINSCYAINNRVGFYGYEGQGRIYVTFNDSPAAESFDLYTQ